MKDRTINILDLVAEIFYHWRGMVVWMLIGAILFGSFGAIRNLFPPQVKEEVISPIVPEIVDEDVPEEEVVKKIQYKLAELKNTLTPVERGQVELAVNYERYINSYNCSVLMSLDPNEVHEQRMIFYIKSDNYDKSYSIEHLYETKIVNEMNQWIAENSSEKMTVVDANALIDMAGTSANGLPHSDTFTMLVMHRSEEECKELSQLVVDYINDQYNEISRTAGYHTIELVSSAYSIQEDNNVAIKQASTVTTLNSYKKSADTAKASFTDEQNAYYSMLVLEKEYLTVEIVEEVEEEPVEQEETETVETVPVVADTIDEKPTVETADVISYLLIGAILFWAIYVFYIVMKYILSKKLNMVDDIKELYDIPQIGKITKQSPEKRRFDAVDKLLWKIFKRGNSKYTEQELLLTAIANIKVMAKRDKLNEVYCIGCADAATLSDVSAIIKAELDKDNIKVSELNNLVYNREAIEQLQNVRTVFLLKKAGVSVYEDIYKELEMLRDQDIKVLGAIVVE